MVIKNSKNELYIGLDDSNHAGKTKQEIIVSIFSTFKEDSIVKKFPNRRDYEKTMNLLKSKKRDYRFLLLPHEISKSNKYNLPLVAPYLIEDYLNANSIKDYETNIYLYFNGDLKNNWKKILKEDFKDFKGLEMKTFSSRGKQPLMVKLADTLANMLYRSPFNKLSQNKSFILVPEEKIIERRKLFHN